MKIKVEGVQATKQVVQQVVQQCGVPVLYHWLKCQRVRALAQMAHLEGGAQSPVEWLRGAAAA